jgi:hypothetical protein
MILLKFLQQQISPSYLVSDYVRNGWWLVSVPILLGVFLYAVFTILRDWRAPKRSFFRAVLLVVATVVGADLASYLEEAYLRITVNPSRCIYDRLPQALYEVMVCTTAGLPQDGIAEGFVRLRSTIDGTILAEESFNNPTYYEVFWTPDHVLVGVGDGSANIRLPPTRWDWLRAKLP